MGQLKWEESGRSRRSCLPESRLVPRWLSVWGLAGAILYLGTPLCGTFGPSVGFLMAPLLVQETVPAEWLIASGFNPSAGS